MGPEQLARNLKVLGDPLRIRILGVLQEQELNVSELAEIFNAGQPRLSTHLARLADAGLVAGRREGRHTYYGTVREALPEPLFAGLRASPEFRTDRDALRSVLRRRRDTPPPGSLGRDYLPGRTWEGFAKALLAVLPPLRIADLGIGSGEMTVLLARAAGTVIAVDSSQEVLRRAQERVARAGLENVQLRAGDFREPPIRRGEVDVWLLSQVLHLVEDPERALKAAADRLEPGGRVVVLELLAHHESWVLERLGHRLQGFGEEDLTRLLEDAGFLDVSVERVSRDRKPPHFVTLMAVGRS